MQTSFRIVVFLWKGVDDPTPVQRIGAWISALFLILLSLSIFDSAMDRESALVKAIGVLAGLWFVGVACKVFLNGFSRRKSRTQGRS
jgi:hypothetical protein